MNTASFFRIFKWLPAWMGSIVLIAAEAPVAEPVFISGQGGYHTYRIPALVVSKAGTLLAFCEGRKTGRGDHGDLDLLLKRSTNNGATWDAQQLIHEEGGNAKITIGNPCPVVDRSTGHIWLAFSRTHPDWKTRATFCLLSGASAGHNFFGDKGIEGQKSAWRLEKLRFLAEQGFELCAHTVWHADLAKYGDLIVQEQIARNVLAIDSAISGYRVRTFALPLGSWPKNRALARAGRWKDPRSGREVQYAFDAVLKVSGSPVPSPSSDTFNPHALERIQVFAGELEKLLDRLDRAGDRYVSSGTVRPNRPKPATSPRR